MPTFHPAGLLGTGTYGRVYACTEQDDRGVTVRDGLAIKYLSDEWLRDEQARNRFRREVRLTRGLSHRGIIPILYSNLSAERPYIVMPLATSSLTERARGGHASDRAWSLQLFGRLVEAMAYAHEKGVVHRDLKPDNVLFLDRGPAICDFGMGKDLMAIPTAQTKTSQPMGTLTYMAPEQWSDARSATYPADVFSLGKLLWELLANRAPRPWQPQLEFIENERLRGFIERCTLEEPGLRYKDAAETLRAWNLLSGDLEAPRHPLEQARALIEQWTRARQGPDMSVIGQLDALLQRQAGDELLYYDLMPQLPARMLSRYCEQLPEHFAATLVTYAKHIEGELPWEYCDEAACVYATAFEASPDEATRKLALTELLRLGERHERYNVADVVRTILWSARDETSAKLVAQVLEQSPQTAWYRHWRTFSKPLDARIKAALRHAPKRQVTPT